MEKNPRYRKRQTLYSPNRHDIHIIEQRQYRREIFIVEGDFMDNIKSNWRAGYAYVPNQRLEKLYSPSKAMKAGTVFPELDITLDEYERGLFNGK